MRSALPSSDEGLEDRVVELDAGLFEVETEEVAAAFGRGPRASRRLRRVLRRRYILLGLLLRAHAQCFGHGFERRELLGELELELRGVDALGLGDEDTTLEQLELEPELLVGLSEKVSLSLEVHDAAICRGELGFQLRDTSLSGDRQVDLEHDARACS
jgi:hypothetical protein